MPGFVDDAGTALGAAARLGPYFAWLPERVAGEPDWRPFSDLLEPEVAAERVAAGRRVIARSAGMGPEQVEERVAASVVFLGFASRLVSPLLATAALTGVIPAAAPARLRWRAAGSGPLPIAYGEMDALDGSALELNRVAVQGLVAPLVTVFRRRFVLSQHVLWGNVASAVGGAAGMIAEERAAALASELLALPPLAGMATVARQPRWFLRRRNCCLYYRIPGGGTCGDCVLVRNDPPRAG
ncbi:MAG: (2Fe-2S)-binding protein [Actinomycetota bacterium]|nr:(2Fe-2S)-binding protein [Actinomycetota bacterium]